MTKSGVTSIRSILFLLTLLAYQFASAQKEVRLYEKGITSLNDHRYSEAYNYFKSASEANSEYLDINYRLALAAFLSGASDEASIDDLIAFEEAQAEADDHYYYWMGQIFLRRYQIDAAVSAFERFRDRVDYLENDEEETLEMLNHIEDLKAYFKNPDNYEIHHLEAPVNSSFSELSPVYLEQTDELLFVSNRSGDPIYSIYHSTGGPNGWTDASEIRALGKFSEQNANIELTADGKLYLYKEVKGGDLYFSEKKNNHWTVPSEFDSRVSNRHLDAHFFINQHEDRIIFTSLDKQNGFDLYESFFDPENEKWSQPSPFHTAINTPYDEDSPYLTPDEKTIYFSSNRPGGVGGYDIYAAHYDEVALDWSEPKNMGWPINSPNDELHFKVNLQNNSGYFVSDRLHTLGGFDIYFFWPIQQVSIEGRVFDAQQQSAVSDAEIRFYPSQYLDEAFISPIDKTGKYRTRIISDETFKVEIIKNSQIIHSEYFEINANGNKATTHIKDFTIQ